MINIFPFTYTRIPNKLIIISTIVNQFFAFATAFIVIPRLFIVTNTCKLHVNVQVSCQDTCLVSLILGIRLHTSIFVF